MSELRDRVVQDLKLAGLKEGTAGVYLRAVRQLAAYYMITGGGITPDGEHWEPARGEFLVPVAVLSKKIAAKFRDALKKQRPDLFATIPATVWRREWVSFLKHYGHGNDAVLNYLSRYVFRTAIVMHVSWPWTRPR